MRIEQRKIAELAPVAYNPRKDLQPGDAEYEKLKASIERFGYVAPAIFNKQTSRLVGGHQQIKDTLHPSAPTTRRQKQDQHRR